MGAGRKACVVQLQGKSKQRLLYSNKLIRHNYTQNMCFLPRKCAVLGSHGIVRLSVCDVGDL